MQVIYYLMSSVAEASDADGAIICCSTISAAVRDGTRNPHLQRTEPSVRTGGDFLLCAPRSSSRTDVHGWPSLPALISV